MKPTIGRTVHYVPPQSCVGPASLCLYPAIITQVNPEVAEDEQLETCELVTFGPNSVYFQHKVPFSETPKPGCWSWPPRV